MGQEILVGLAWKKQLTNKESNYGHHNFVMRVTAIFVSHRFNCVLFRVEVVVGFLHNKKCSVFFNKSIELFLESYIGGRGYPLL